MKSQPTPNPPDPGDIAVTPHAPPPQTIPQISFPEQLPVSARRDDIAAALASHQVVIVCGETGSGKTTQLPKIVFAARQHLAQPGRKAKLIGMTQPRRIAAKSVAQRLAEETQTRLGGFIGWQVRFHDQCSPESRIKVMTDGILLAETQSDPEFRAYDTIILDEAHERSLNIDFLLGYLKNLLSRRPDLKLILSSATLEAERFSAWFGHAPVIEVSGRTFPVEVRYQPPAESKKEKQEKLEKNKENKDERNEAEDADIELALLHAVDELAREGPGDVLVFLPGEREIREAQEALRKHHPPHTEILPLFARLSVGEQERIFQPHSGRRIVLATNVAETSLTVPGIRYVVDAGTARVKRYSIRNKIEQLKIEKVSQAAANQRAGRCGRVAEGICIRLYDEQDFQARPAYTTPELLRSSLAGVILRMKALKLPDIEHFPFIDAPEPKRIRDGQALLRELGALDEQDRLTRIGQQLGRLPIDPRIGRMLIAAREMAVLHEVLVIAAFLSVQDPRDRPLERQEAADQKHRRFTDENSDFVSILKLWQHLDQLTHHRKSQRKFRDALKDDFLSPNRVREWRDIHAQLATHVKELGWKVDDGKPASTPSPTPQTEGESKIGAPAPFPELNPARYANLHQALLPGLLGNLGMLTENNDYLGARGMKFLPFPGSGVKKKPKWIMAAEIVETRRVYARTLAKIEPAWVERAAGPMLKTSFSDPHWAKKPAHVAAAMRATLYGLPVVNGRKVHYGPIDPVLSREIFIRSALVEGEYETRSGFFANNRKLLKEIDDLSHRSRDARVAVDENALYAWFDDRIPEGLHNGAAFEKWLRETEAKSPRLLHLSRQELLKERGANPQDFPKEIDLGGVRFALAYRFDPGADDDGVTLMVPLPALNQVPIQRCEWLVPGLLLEKITALIKGLPQSVRRAFVPVPDFARAAAEALKDETPSKRLTDALADFLQKTTGQVITRDAWRPDAVPPHLQMNYRVLDADNRILGESRDLLVLRQQLGESASASLKQATAPQERDAVGRWDFGDLPEQVEIDSGKRKVAAFPTLVEEAGKVQLRLIDSPATARIRHRRGVSRLLWQAFPDLLKQTERDLAQRLKPVALQYMMLDKSLTLEKLLADILYSAAQAALAQAGVADPAALRQQNAFESAAQSARKALADQARETARLAAECIAHTISLGRQLAQPRPPNMREAISDMQAQLAALVFPGFIADTPHECLHHLPRYLKGMEKRLEKLAKAPDRDAQSQRSLTPLLRAWDARIKREQSAGGASAGLVAFGWRLQELRISLFAQELKTPEPVSVKRLERLWAELTL